MIARYDVITSWLAPWETHFVEPVVFGTTDPRQIASLLNAFCQQELGAAIYTRRASDAKRRENL